MFVVSGPQGAPKGSLCGCSVSKAQSRLQNMSLPQPSSPLARMSGVVLETPLPHPNLYVHASPPNNPPRPGGGGMPISFAKLHLPQTSFILLFFSLTILDAGRLSPARPQIITSHLLILDGCLGPAGIL